LKIIISDAIYEEIKRLQSLGYGTRAISKEVNLSRTAIIRAFKELGLKNTKNVSRSAHLVEKKCTNCQLVKSIDNFYSSIKANGTLTYKNVCKECNSLICNKRRQNNHTAYYNREKRYRETNRELINSNYREYTSKRKDEDPAFKLRRDISSWIANILSARESHKSASCFQDYTIDELFIHIENQFEWWMTWKNRGKYNPKTWDDNDPTTWTWQLDHIVPHSLFDYKDVNDEEYKKCWALNNLRPLSAKQNVLDGVKKVRHGKKEEK